MRACTNSWQINKRFNKHMYKFHGTENLDLMNTSCTTHGIVNIEIQFNAC